MAPVALLAAAAAVYAIAAGGGSDDGGGRPTGDEGRTTTARQVTRTTRTVARRRTYTVKPGDVLSSIAVKTGVTVEELQALNPGIDAQTLQPGDKLKLR
jgi:teichoic acid transport system ATP-binding protein